MMDIKIIYADLKKKVKHANSKSSLEYLKSKGDNTVTWASSPNLHPKFKKQAEKSNIQLKKAIRKRSNQLK